MYSVFAVLLKSNFTLQEVGVVINKSLVCLQNLVSALKQILQEKQNTFWLGNTMVLFYCSEFQTYFLSLLNGPK